MSRPPQPVLIIYSHGRNPPLQPPPDLKYDLRNIPNPPKALRDVSDGCSKRLREHLLSEPKFNQRLELVEQEVLTAMESKLAEYAPSSTVESIPEDQGHANEHDSLPEEKDSRTNSSWVIDDRNEEEPKATSADNEVILRVGCNCALGHHRSVAFVEELARRDWPKEWQVQVEHRDLHVKRAGRTRAKQKSIFREKKADLTEQYI
ncbi:hypothetical protein K458DRAFT_419109 [Lentithecium fluviatile CBS 122367]|uniref:RapZ C-terminal domain-containing protein n=1 Tax=Lentithecium fluviatile CBS 122367 TaxID=1168545 RepID=A0A6G1IZZ8_9PLEO|nr:hypothetical protein K458DRAFT_419109 [Lentithecium fluviatile CBS 122367]